MRNALLFAMSLFATQVLAEEVKFGESGAYFCTKQAEGFQVFAKLVEGVPISEKSTECAKVAGGKTVELSQKEVVSGVAIGLGEYDRGGSLERGMFIYLADGLPRRTSEGRTFKAVDPADVRNTPEKWQGRDLEFRSVNVYWVSNSDVRILTNTALTLFVSKPRGKDIDLDYLRDVCETSREASGPKCRVIVRFSYQKHGTDHPNGYTARTVLMSNDAEIIRLQRK